MKVVVAGGSGWLGRALCAALVSEGADVVILSRSPSPHGIANGARAVQWDGRTLGLWADEIDGADAVVNLSGQAVASKRWTQRRKQELRDSRIEPTRALVGAIGQAQARPRVLVNASAVGYYGDRGDEPLTEISPPGNDFLARLVVDWEHEAIAAAELGIRTVLLRCGIVLGRDGGALRPLSIPFQAFLGGHVGSGRQWVSWVHMDDVVGLFRLAIEREDASGPINLTAPETVTNRELSRSLGRVLGRPSWLPVPAFVLRLTLGEMAEALLISQRVAPAVAEQLGYDFKYPLLETALRDALR
ncbi:MAG: hypothetical protein HW416_744 [Chloroflexi bacterium]|nr:hypothetical protein [Chloroflexota bacterium]